MLPKNCFICGNPFPPGKRKCPRCGAEFTPKEELTGFLKDVFSQVNESVDIPLEFWKDNNLIFEADFEEYTNPDNLTEKYKVQKTRQFEHPEYWYLLKFFFIESQFFKTIEPTTGNALLISGVPSQLKIRCNCGKILNDDQWLKAFFTPSSALGNPRHEYFLRISEKCENCGKTICIYRPKTGVYIALLVFLSFIPSIKILYPNLALNFDSTTDLTLLINWVTIIDEAIQKDPNNVCSLYYEDIQNVWQLMESNKLLPETTKELYPFNKILKHYYISFKHRGRTLLAVFSKGIIEILREGLKAPNQKINVLFSITTTLYNELGSWIYGNTDPKYLYFSLRTFIDQNNSITLKHFSKIKDFLNFTANDMLMVLKENNIDDPDVVNPRNIEVDDENMELIWRSGEMVAWALQIINFQKVSMGESSINALVEMFDALGDWIYGGKDFKKIPAKFEAFKRILTLQHDAAFDSVIGLVRRFNSDYDELISKKAYGSMNIKQSQQISHGIILGKICNFLRDSEGKAFTFRALDNRIEDIFEDPNEKEYCKRNLQNILKELTSKNSINSVQHGDVTHYFFQ